MVQEPLSPVAKQYWHYECHGFQEWNTDDFADMIVLRHTPIRLQGVSWNCSRSRFATEPRHWRILPGKPSTLHSCSLQAFESAPSPFSDIESPTHIQSSSLVGLAISVLITSSFHLSISIFILSVCHWISRVIELGIFAKLRLKSDLRFLISTVFAFGPRLGKFNKCIPSNINFKPIFWGFVWLILLPWDAPFALEVSHQVCQGANLKSGITTRTRDPSSFPRLWYYFLLRSHVKNSWWEDETLYSTSNKVLESLILGPSWLYTCLQLRVGTY